ncbi:class II glutamine amidotransferase [Escherichia coli]
MAYCSTNLHWITRRAPFGVATLLDQHVENALLPQFIRQ